MYIIFKTIFMRSPTVSSSNSLKLTNKYAWIIKYTKCEASTKFQFRKLNMPE